jgi:hypothetical protein
MEIGVTGWQDAAQGASHVVSEVQRFGLLSAAAVVDRYIEIVNRGMVGDPFRHVREAVDITATGPVDGAARMLEAWLQALDTAARLIPEAIAPGTEILVLPRTEPGHACEASMWIHNRTTSLVASVELHSTILVSPEALTIPVDTVTFLPQATVVVEPGTCREVTVRVRVPQGQPPGQYHGLVLGSAAPDGAISLLLEVEGAGEVSHGRPSEWLSRTAG